MKIADLVFIGIRGSVVAVDRGTGAQVWATHLKGYDFVNVLVEGNMVLATAYGEIYCLDALTGSALWHNPLKGFGRGLVTLATVANPGGSTARIMAEHRRREEAAAAAS